MLAALLAPVSLRAQLAVLSGQVRAQGSGTPLSGARISVGTTVADTTNADGSYRLTLPSNPGAFKVRVTKLGYFPTERQLDRVGALRLAADFELAARPLGLDAIVVTGSAGPAQLRSVGHSISEIRAAEIKEPVASVDQLLMSRVPGLVVFPSTGLAGSGAKIRLRGNASIALSNQPLVYVDGVRVRSDSYPKNAPRFGEASRGPNDTPSPLDDIEPTDIDHVEIVRGPAATTLYGTEAAPGVIQIFTKRGEAGRTLWSTQFNTGLNRVRPFGTNAEPYMRLDPWLRDAVSAGYSISVGGGEDVRYFVSTTYDRNEGVLPNDLERRRSVRGNVDFKPSRKLALSWSSALTLDDLSNTSSGPNGHGLTQNAYRGPANATGLNTKESLDRILVWDITTNLNHAIAGATAVFTPDRRASHTFTVGYDRATDALRSLRPYGFVFAPQGILTTERWQATTSSVDYLGRGSFDFGAVQATVAWGGQSITTDISSVAAYGEGFSSPAEPTVTGAAITHAAETITRSVIAGGFSQVSLSWKDRLYLTGGLRMDGSSSFGSDFGLKPFPRLNGTWIISEERFWPSALGTMKLRAAYGKAGRAPGVFDASRTWSALSYDGKSAFLPSSVGNTHLGPETSTETEIGFDSESGDADFQFGLTLYRNTTTGALLPVQQAPSLGFLQPQLQNVGTFRASGAEISAAKTWRLGSMALDAGISLAVNHTRALDLGGSPDFIIDEVAWVRKGAATPVLIGALIKNPDELAEPVFEENHVFGSNNPTRVLGFNGSLSMPRGIVLSARFEHQGGSYVLSNAERSLYAQGTNPVCQSGYDKLASQGRNALTAWERVWCVVASVRRDGPIVPGDFVRLRDASASVPLPGASMRSRHVSITLSARNFLLSKSREVRAFEPDMTGRDGMLSPVRTIEFGVPTPSSLTVAVRSTFW